MGALSRVEPYIAPQTGEIFVLVLAVNPGLDLDL